MRDVNIVQAVLQQYMASKIDPLIGMPIGVEIFSLVYSNGCVSHDEIAKLIKQYLKDEELPTWQRKQYKLLEKQIRGLKEAAG